MAEIVINTRYGGFGLSHEAILEYGRRIGTPLYAYVSHDFKNYVPVTDEEAKSAYVVHYRTSPDFARDDTYWSDNRIARDDPTLITLLKDWGSERVSGKHAALVVVNIPDGVEWEIEEYDGTEWVSEKHRTWYAGAPT